MTTAAGGKRYRTVSRNEMEKVAYKRYETFDQQCRTAEAREVDAANPKEIEHLEQELKN